MKIYTRTGDDGTTGVLGPDRMPKCAARIEAFGAVDELNAALGVVSALDRERSLGDEIERLQRDLFQVGAELATTAPAMLEKLSRLSDDDVTRLERWIDRAEETLAPLTRFILPGGTPLAAQLHLARAICRRAERRLVALHSTEPIEPRLVRFLNRLADLLFVWARWCNAKAGVADVEWEGRERGTD